MAINENAQISFISYLLGIGLWPFVSGADFPVYLSFLLAAIYLLVIYASLSSIYSEASWSVAWRGLLLGETFGLGIFLFANGSNYNLIGLYLSSLGFFHWSEYFTTAVTNPRSLTLDSYLLNHSLEYHIAAVACLLEFLIECFLFSSWKQLTWISYLGLFMVVSGELLRKLAMFTAGSNFNHYVQYIKHDNHVLVTGGIYSWFRHPSYLGWFCWSVGTQVMLKNPVCLLCYTVVSWKFFARRIEEEEKTLLYFFGKDYVNYQKRVGTGLPFIKGYKTNL